MEKRFSWYKKHQVRIGICGGIILGIIVANSSIRITLGYWPDIGLMLVLFAFAIGLFLSCVLFR